MQIKSAFALVLLSAGASAEVLYKVTDLGLFSASGINSHGQVSGTADIGTFELHQSHAFLYTDGHLVDLGTLGGFQSFGAGINELGQVTGSSGTPKNWRAFLYTDGHMLNLGVPGPGYTNSTGFAINNRGEVTGYLEVVAELPTYHPFLYSGGQIVDIGALPGAHYNVGVGINDQDQIAGQYGERDPGRSFLYSDGVFTDIGGLRGPNAPGSGAGVLAISNLGHLTGYSDGAAFLYINGRMTNIGLNCGGSSINDLDQIVGACRQPGPEAYRAFLYSGGVSRDLNDLIDPTLGIVLQGAAGISNNGLIAVNGLSADGQGHGYLLTPVPEPGTLPILVVLLCVMPPAARRRPQSLPTLPASTPPAPPSPQMPTRR